MRTEKAVPVGLVVAVAVVVLQALLVPLFAGPAANIGARDLPIAVAGPPDAVAPLVARLRAAGPGAFEVRVVADATAADTAIRQRDVYGAIVLDPTGPSLHIASAASPTVATLLTQAATSLSSQPGAAPAQSGATPSARAGAAVMAVRDVVGVDSDDPRGTGFAAGFLPLALTGMAAGGLIFFLVRRRAARVVALVTYAVLAGLVGAAVQHYWLGVLPGDYFAAAGVMALFALAVPATMAGLAALFGPPGLGLGAAVMFLVGNALSGVTSAPELLPQPWGAAGQWLPIGAAGTLLRSVAYFDGHGGFGPVTVLTAYTIGGLILVLVGRRGIERRVDEAVVVPEPAPAVSVR